MFRTVFIGPEEELLSVILSVVGFVVQGVSSVLLLAGQYNLELYNATKDMNDFDWCRVYGQGKCGKIPYLK